MAEGFGTAGNRTGYKEFCFNTTIRNPKRNRDFLLVFVPFNGQKFDDKTKRKYYYSLIRNGVYHLSDVPQSVKEKWDNDIELDDEEIRLIVNDNPQACNDEGRAMTQLRALKDQGFLRFDGKRDPYIYITQLGQELIDNIKDPTITYTKAMLGVHANSVVRTTILNLSRPFLNTLFVIREVNKKWKELDPHNEGKGILFHEFGAFVLTMKDCDYESCANRIIEYRKLFRFQVDYDYINNFFKTEDILPLAFDSIIHEYPDDVYRKFAMTGLVVKRGSHMYQYVDFSQYNYSKVESILEQYSNYKFQTFASAESYYQYLADQQIPWESNLTLRNRIVEEKARVLSITLNDSYTLEQKEEFLDRQFYAKSLQKAVNKYDYYTIGKELLILSNHVKEKSIFDTISEPLRLEYLLALYFGKKYGLKGLISNIIYDEDGLPLHCAPGGKGDIIFHDGSSSYILEPTMITSRAQQLNSETTNIVRHMKDEESKYNVPHRVMMIAPIIHADVASFFRYQAKEEDAKITTVTIDRTVGLFAESETLNDLGVNFDEIVKLLVTLKAPEYTEKINSYRYQL